MPAFGDSLPPQAAWIELPDQRSHVLAGDCRIGRTEENDIVNPDIRISRKHSVVQRQGNHYMLIDLGSTNGCYVNGRRVRKQVLQNEDVLMIGKTRYRFTARALGDPVPH